MTMPIPAPNAPLDHLIGEPTLSAQDWADLAEAVDALERASLARSLNRLMGAQIKAATNLIPKRMAATVSQAVSLALGVALKAAIRSLGMPSEAKPLGGTSILAHRAAAALSGAAGGAFGLAMLPIELPISTTIMMRSIAEIARAEGEDLSQPAGALACLEVFALGGSPDEEAWESGYFAVRGVLAKAVGSATAYFAGRTVVDESAPALLRYISLVAARFGAAVTQKLAAQAIPVLGAAGGATVNYLFMEHFQRLAKGHFAVRRLERRFGVEAVREAYERIRLARAGDRATEVTTIEPQ